MCTTAEYIQFSLTFFHGNDNLLNCFHIIHIILTCFPLNKMNHVFDCSTLVLNLNHKEKTWCLKCIFLNYRSVCDHFTSYYAVYCPSQHLDVGVYSPDD